ncbi:MAG: ComF family protein [Rubrivivax sp.]|nr:ComF family protein [Rubrivivax sp.]
MHPPVSPAQLSVPSRTGRAGLATQCELCRQWTQGDALCADCEACFAQPRLRCACCALPTGTAVARCGGCLATPELPYTGTVAAVDYAFPWDGLVTAFKFSGRVDLAEALARRLADAVTDAVAASSPHDAAWVLPVPLSPARLAERGYNQAWELARRVARLRGLPSDATLLQRPIDTAHQTGLDRAARTANLAGSFMVDPNRRAELAGRSVALVDDVMTTGATVAAAAAVLRRAGAASVSVWVFARTPAPGRD